MGTRIKNILRFVAVPAGGTASLPHELSDQDGPLIPDRLDVDAAGFDVALSLDGTEVEVTNNGVAAADVDVLCTWWHTIERAFGDPSRFNLIPKPFIMTPDGTGATVRERELIPECWQQQDVPAAQAATVMETGVSQLFTDYQMIRDGSVIGVNLRFTDVLTAGDATAVVTVNGVPTALTIVVAAGASSGRAVAAAGVIPYVAGDRIGATLATAAGFLPDGSLDAEVSIEVNAAA